MATESRSGLTGHLRSVTTTTLASLSGVLAALVSAAVVGTDAAAATNQRTVFIIVAIILAQFVIHRAIGIDVDDYGVKDYLYIAFMTFSLWFICFAIILTAGVEVPFALSAGTVPVGLAGLALAPASVRTNGAGADGTRDGDAAESADVATTPTADAGPAPADDPRTAPSTPTESPASDD